MDPDAVRTFVAAADAVRFQDGSAVREGAGLRPVDLARVAGVSTQQIRNYEEAGILPPAARTLAGYRRFEERHRRAVVTYRALLKGYGSRAAQAIMRAVHAGDLPRALTLVDAEHATLHQNRLSLEAASEALEAIARQAPDTEALPRTGLSVGEVAARLGVRSSALRVWEAAGLLAPGRDPATGYRRFGAADVRDARLIAVLRQSHYPLPRIRSVMEELRRTGSREALRAALDERREALNRQTTAMLEGSGRLHDYITT
ncbi:MerR family transcriptional regulator [Actinoallomurus vinaceus]|uniref:MerR family transcriptional regulator n=1 Tax=Actinoallomurus vinaceus TaxID=1080074 RepID=UPI0031E880AB